MIRLLRTYLRPYSTQILVVLGLLLVQSIGNLYLPTLNGDIINDGVAKGDNDFILRTGGFMLVVTLVLGVASIIAVYLGARTAMGFGRDVRSAIFRKVESFSQVEVNQFGPASLITRNTNDVQQVQMVVFMTLTLIITAPIRVDSGQMPIGNLTAFLQYLLQIMFSMLMAVFMFVFVPRAAVSAGRIQEVLDTEPLVRDPEQPRPMPAIAGASDGRVGGRVDFRDVEFRYPGAEDPVLHDLSFTARPGETVAIVG